MMGHQPQAQNKLFYTRLNLDKRVRKDHILRKIDNRIDFDFIYKEVKDKYGQNGNVSVPPPVILKMMLVLILYNVRSERELMDTIPERLDWLWFLGYDLDDEIPNHSVLSKARTRWGVEAFKSFFERIVLQCAQSGLIDGSKLFMDSSLVQADASNNSVVDQTSLSRYLRKSYQLFEKRLESQDVQRPGINNKKYVSTTDPDASVVRKGAGKSKLKYQTHRGVDGRHEIITAAEVTPGSVNEAHRLKPLIDQHQKNTGEKVETCVADSKYGTKDNYLTCHDLGIKSHFKSVEKTHRGSGRRKGIFPKEDFTYHPESDTFTCPAGKELKKRNYNKRRKYHEYKASAKDCKKCELRSQCTRSKFGRSLNRHIRQDDLDKMLQYSESQDARKDLITRQHLMERSFARAKRYGYKRSRWRRLWRVQIQEYLTAAIQNIQVLVRHVKEPSPVKGMALSRSEHLREIRYNKVRYSSIKALLSSLFKPFINSLTDRKIIFVKFEWAI